MKLSKEKIDVWRQILGMISQQMTHPRDLVWAHHHRDCKWVWKDSKKVWKKIIKENSANKTKQFKSRKWEFDNNTVL